MNVTINYPAVATQSPLNLRTLKGWDDHVMMADGFSAFARPDATGNPIGQFALVTPYIVRGGAWVGTWSSNSNAYKLTPAQVEAIQAMQVANGFTLKQKWGWLTYGGADTWGAPLRIAPDGTVKIIAAVYAGNPVEVLERRDILLSFNGAAGMVSMSRIRTGFSVVHDVTTVDRNNTFYMQTPVGIVKLPLFANSDEWWLMDRWLR